jgi:hypothetical protein
MPDTVEHEHREAQPPVTHAILVRDLRSRFGDPELYAAECSCGWRGEERRTSNPARAARRDGARHVEGEQGTPAAPRPGSARN